MSDEWGLVYSCIMTDANEAVRPVHNRMPVILHQDDWERWLNGSFDDLLALQERVYPSELIEIARTDELRVKRKSAQPTA